MSRSENETALRNLSSPSYSPVSSLFSFLSITRRTQQDNESYLEMFRGTGITISMVCYS